MGSIVLINTKLTGSNVKDAHFMVNYASKVAKNGMDTRLYITLAAPYADDTKIVGSETHQSILQNNIDSAITWSENNYFHFIFTKLKFMKFSLQNCADKELSFQAREHQTEPVKSIKDLGVNFSQNFFWDFYTDFIVKRGLQKLAQTRRVMPA